MDFVLLHARMVFIFFSFTEEHESMKPELSCGYPIDFTTIAPQLSKLDPLSIFELLFSTLLYFERFYKNAY